MISTKLESQRTKTHLTEDKKSSAISRSEIVKAEFSSLERGFSILFGNEKEAEKSGRRK